VAVWSIGGCGFVIKTPPGEESCSYALGHVETCLPRPIIAQEIARKLFPNMEVHIMRLGDRLVYPT